MSLQVKTSEKAMRNKLLPPEALPALLAIADEIIEGKKEQEQVGGVKLEASLAPFDGEAAAEMAAGWSRTFAAVPRFGSTAEYGLSGLAAAVILAATPRYAPSVTGLLGHAVIGLYHLMLLQDTVYGQVLPALHLIQCIDKHHGLKAGSGA